MYAGKVVESADVVPLFKEPLHPYTWGLLNSIPKLTEKRKKKLLTIEGIVPDVGALPPGCSFEPRCRFSDKLCQEKEPVLEMVEDGRKVRCWHFESIKEQKQELHKKVS